MKKLIALLLALVILMGLAGCGKDEEEANPVLRIGVFEPFTGVDSEMGLKEVVGIQYAHSLRPSVDIGNQTYDIELVYADNASSVAQSAEVAASLLEHDVSLILGSYGSSYCLAAAPVFEKAGVAAIGISCTAPALTANYDCYYRVCIQDNLQGAALAKFIKDELECSNVLCLGLMDSEYEEGLVDGFVAAAEDLDLDYQKMSFSENTGDFTYFLSSIPEQKIDIVFAPCSSRHGKLIVEAMNALEEPVPVVGADTWDNDAMRDAAVGKNFRIFTSTFYAEGYNASFESKFKEWIMSDQAAFANNGGTDELAAVTVMGFDAYNLALSAISKAGSAHYADILAVMPTVSSSGVAGVINFDETGDAIRTSIFIKRADTETPLWKYVKSQRVK